MIKDEVRRAHILYFACGDSKHLTDSVYQTTVSIEGKRRGFNAYTCDARL